MLIFILNSTLLGVGLAMDAFSVSIANGLAETKMRGLKVAVTAGTYSFFQFLMPMTGWICVHSIVEYFSVFEKIVPYIALGLLLYIGIKMITQCLRKKEMQQVKRLSVPQLLMQGVATSIDALSVGFTIAGYELAMAFLASVIIAVVTFIICVFGLIIGKKFGDKFTKAEMIGGIILIVIGIEIFVKGILS